ncbi:Haloacid dehalogenase-like hydrolase [Blastocystis sp. ATCC 50177/Nand II]|uniref:Haloacid dehalogenase-like hydrolase n=1 Tax=Blastocystis sp. subtype 1 (strain ATCC 50177 / NandII) TaxID=478820 RepID=A0A196SK53_BLAHN|nr:Haloacid dehalogenase-like hydrolase [Blastocystis sp. ATCC 50177/Nand II]
MKGRWNEVKNQNGVLYTFNCPDRFSAPIKMALFDLDNTLIRYSKGDYNSVSLLYGTVPQRLQQYVWDGWRVVVLTNQAGVALKLCTLADMKRKIEKAFGQLQCDVTFIVAPYYDGNRKPHTGMFSYLNELCDSMLSRRNCFYCGDMAGRIRDKNDSDALFASRCGIPFYTPEQLF